MYFFTFTPQERTVCSNDQAKGKAREVFDLRKRLVLGRAVADEKFDFAGHQQSPKRFNVTNDDFTRDGRSQVQSVGERRPQ